MRKREKEDRRQWRESESAQLALRAAIAAVLKQLHDKHEEVPLVAMYRKELCGELLAQRREDLSLWTSAREARQRADRNQPIFHEGTVQVNDLLSAAASIIFVQHGTPCPAMSEPQLRHAAQSFI